MLTIQSTNVPEGTQLLSATGAKAGVSTNLVLAGKLETNVELALNLKS